MSLSPLAGKIAPKEILENILELTKAYYANKPDPINPTQKVSFGTSGHRGCSYKYSFNEAHILAITQAVVEFRKAHNVSGALFIGMDTHALSTPAHQSALEVLAGNGVLTYYAKDFGYTPTPVISNAILTHSNSDGIVVTPSHNPPSDGGFKYNFIDGGPADEKVTAWVENRANELLANNLEGVKTISVEEGITKGILQSYDYVTPYVENLGKVIDMDAIKKSQIKIAADAMGGSGMEYYKAIARFYELNMEVLHSEVDFTFSFMTCDKDGKIRMDCSSKYAMTSLVALKENYDIAFGNDTDFDRHGIVTKDGLMDPNHYLSVAIDYLAKTRNFSSMGVGKTLVSSSMIDKIARANSIALFETPVGFKWFVSPMSEKKIFFGGEESAGASFLCFDGKAWSTDKDGIIMALLSAEILAKTATSPSEYYTNLTKQFGAPKYKRIDVPTTFEIKQALKNLSAEAIKQNTLANDPIQSVLTTASNGAKIGGLKINTANGWFAIRPSGTEDVYKIYAESFCSQEHLEQIISEAKMIVNGILG